MTANLKFGLVLPHFGQHASTKKCLEGSIKAEAYGFDSVWVRDHLVFTPYAVEGTDNTHIEGLLVLSAVAAVTKSLTLGTAMTICHRNPIHLAQCFAALSRIANGRVIMGIGLGGFPHEFAAAGLPSGPAERVNLARINADLCRRLWAGEGVSYKDAYYSFQGCKTETSSCQSYSDLVWRLDTGCLPEGSGVWRRMAARANHTSDFYKTHDISPPVFSPRCPRDDHGGSDALHQHRQR